MDSIEPKTSFSVWLGGSAADKEPPEKKENTSVLSDWKSYESSNTMSSKLLSSAEEGSATMKKLASGAFSSVTAATSSVVESVQGAPGTTQYVYFAAFAGIGVLLLLVAFFLFLPMIIIRPSKFAITFSLGSVLILVSLGFLRGWKAMFSSLSSKERMVPTAAYLGSLFGTLYASLMMHSYIYSLALCVVQIITLAYYVASLFPGGAEGMQFLGRSSFSMAKNLASSMLSKS